MDKKQEPFKINMTYPTSEMLGKYILSTLETTEAWVVPIYGASLYQQPLCPICNHQLSSHLEEGCCVCVGDVECGCMRGNQPVSEDLVEVVARQLQAVWIAGNLIKRVCPDEAPLASINDIAKSILSKIKTQIEAEERKRIGEYLEARLDDGSAPLEKIFEELLNTSTNIFSRQRS